MSGIGAVNGPTQSANQSPVGIGQHDANRPQDFQAGPTNDAIPGFLGGFLSGPNGT